MELCIFTLCKSCGILQHHYTHFSCKMATQCPSFIIQQDSKISCIEDHTHFSKIIGDGFLNFTPIDRRLYLNMTASSINVFSAVNSAPKLDVCTVVYLFDDQVFGVEPTKEISPVIDLPVTLSCPWYSSKKCSGIMNQIEVLRICHRSIDGNMSTDFQSPSSVIISYTQYLWSGVED